MTFESVLHFNFVAVVGAEEVSAYKQQNNISALKVFINTARPILARQYFPIRPRGYDALSFQESQMGLQFATQGFVVMRIAVYKPDRSPGQGSAHSRRNGHMLPRR